MGDFLTAAELATYMQVDTVDTATADLLINMAEASVRSYCGWNITQETVTDHVVTDDEVQSGRIILPTLYLTDVAEIVEGGVTLTAGTHYRWDRTGIIRRWTAPWSYIWQSITVTYTHGYAPGASELLVVQQVVAAAVSRLMDRVDSLQALRVGGIEETYAVPPQVPAGLLYNEQAALGAFVIHSGP